MADEVKTNVDNEPIREATPIEFGTTECRVCGAEVDDDPSALVEHSKETGHKAF